MACLDPDAVLAFVDGRLKGAALVAAEEHVAACIACEELVTVAVSGQPSTGSHQAHQADVLPRGAAFGRYVVLNLAGRGAMGAVYEAYDTRLECKVALKLLPEQAATTPGSSATSQLLDEAKKLARISHQNVVAVRDAGQIEGRVFVSMEFVDGETLSAWLQEKPRSWRQIRELFVAAGRGLEAAHRAGLVHRDFKPQNVMVAKDGAVRVTDFGLASDFQSKAGEVETALAALDGELSEHTVALTRTGILIGTPLYMAPEQFEGELAEARSDQFSFCVALYHALYGEWPFPVPVASFRVLREAVRAGRLREPPPGSQVPKWLRRILVRGLDVDPSQRFPSMAELLGALDYDPARRYRRFAAAAAVIALAVASAFVARWSPGPRRRIDDAGAPLAAAKVLKSADKLAEATVRATNEGIRDRQTAFHTALAAGRDDIALASATALEMAYGSQLGIFQEADRWDQLADALLRRLGTGHQREAIELSKVRALLKQRRGLTPRSPIP